MAEEKSGCGCGCIPLKQVSEKPAKDKKDAKKSKQVEDSSAPPRGMGVLRKISVPFGLFAELSERFSNWITFQNAYYPENCLSFTLGDREGSINDMPANRRPIAWVDEVPVH